MKSLFLGYASAAQPRKPIIFLSSHSCSRRAVRQMVRKISNCHKSLRFAIYCAAYGTERNFILVFFFPVSLYLFVLSYTYLCLKFGTEIICHSHQMLEPKYKRLYLRNKWVQLNEKQQLQYFLNSKHIPISDPLLLLDNFALEMKSFPGEKTLYKDFWKVPKILKI